MIQYMDFLRKVPLFSELEEEELQQLAGVIREHHYKKNVTIFHVDDSGNAVGASSRRPVVRLCDLAMALRRAESVAQGDV